MTRFWFLFKSPLRTARSRPSSDFSLSLWRFKFWIAMVAPKGSRMNQREQYLIFWISQLNATAKLAALAHLTRPAAWNLASEDPLFPGAAAQCECVSCRPDPRTAFQLVILTVISVFFGIAAAIHTSSAAAYVRLERSWKGIMCWAHQNPKQSFSSVCLSLI